MYSLKVLIFRFFQIFVLSCFVGCGEFLGKEAENSSDDNVIDYSDSEAMFGVVSGLYGQMRSLSFWAGYGLLAVRGDDCVLGGGDGQMNQYLDCEDLNYGAISDFWPLNDYWERLYGAVYVANSALESLAEFEKGITSDSLLILNREYKAQVRVLRAFLYFQISKLWQNSPIIKNNLDGVVPASLQEKRDYMISELSSASEDLPALRPNEMTASLGAVTKYTALALLAKVQLYNQNWAEVERLTSSIISSGKFSLYPNFYNLFKIEGKLCDESLFELQFTDFGNSSGDIITSESWFAAQGPLNTAPPISGWGYFVPSQQIINFMAQKGEGVRYTTTFLMAGELTPSGDYIGQATGTNPVAYNGKAYTPSCEMTEGRVDYGDNNNIRILRYADVLLMNSEALVRQGKNGDESLNIVRKRGGMAPLVGADLDDILDERRVEFALEWGERFFDIVRFSKGAELFQYYVEGESEFYPIPQKQVTLYPSLGK